MKLYWLAILGAPQLRKSDCYENSTSSETLRRAFIQAQAHVSSRNMIPLVESMQYQEVAILPSATVLVAI